jgi:hypothetical protein
MTESHHDSYRQLLFQQPARQPTPHDIQLMSKHRVLSFKPQLRLEWRGQDGQNETEQPDHSASLSDSITASTRIKVFGTHRLLAERAEDIFSIIQHALVHATEARTTATDAAPSCFRALGSRKPTNWMADDWQCFFAASSIKVQIYESTSSSARIDHRDGF